jgi:hypothetical protein
VRLAANPFADKVADSAGEMKTGADAPALPAQSIESLNRFGSFFLEQGYATIFEKAPYLGTGRHQSRFSLADHHIFRPGVDKIGNVIRGDRMSTFSPPFGYYGFIDDFDIISIGRAINDDMSERITFNHLDSPYGLPLL